MHRAFLAVILSLIVFVLISLGGVLAFFCIENSQWVLLRVPFSQFKLSEPFSILEYETPLYLVMLVSFFVGFALAIVLFLPAWFRRGIERLRDRRFIRGLESELADLRNLPVTAPAPLEDIEETRESADAAAPSNQDEEEERALLSAALQDSERGRQA